MPMNFMHFRLPFVVSIDFWQYKVEVGIRNAYWPFLESRVSLYSLADNKKGLQYCQAPKD